MPIGAISTDNIALAINLNPGFIVPRAIQLDCGAVLDFNLPGAIGVDDFLAGGVTPAIAGEELLRMVPFVYFSTPRQLNGQDRANSGRC
jgi:hypothetical protein